MTRILITLLLFVFISCNQSTDNSKPVLNKTSQPASKQTNQQTNQPANPNWKTYNGTDFTIQYPPEWKLNESGQMNTSLVLFSPLESEQDKFTENINLIIQDLKGANVDLDKFADISETQIKSMIPNSSIIESKRVKNNAEEYQKLIYTGDQSNFHLEFEQYYIIKNGKAYVLTLTCEENKFADFRVTGESILNSFTIKN